MWRQAFHPSACIFRERSVCVNGNIFLCLCFPCCTPVLPSFCRMESGDVKEPVVAAAGPANSAAELASPRSKKKRSGPRRTSFERRISARVVYLLAFSIFVATIAVMRSGAVGASWLRTLVWAACLSYLPSYFDGSEFTVEGRHWPWFATLGVFRHFHNYFSFRLEYTTPIDETKRYIICSHPHGVLSAHHPMYLTHKSFLSVWIFSRGCKSAFAAQKAIEEKGLRPSSPGPALAIQ